jgi:hypothetical protein
MSAATPYPMTPKELAHYRAGVEALIAECLARVRNYPIERDPDPVPERARHE